MYFFFSLRLLAPGSSIFGSDGDGGGECHVTLPFLILSVG